jgi:peptide/nickel transport system substrate-binding protein
VCLAFFITGCAEKKKIKKAETIKLDETWKFEAEPGMWLDEIHNHEPVKGGILREAFFLEPDFINPVLSLRKCAKKAEPLVFETILDYSEEGTIIPGLAKSWSFSKDGLTITFKLRENVFFHPVIENNKIVIPPEKMTSQDIEFTIELIMDVKNRSPLKALFDNFEAKNIRITSPDTFQAEYDSINSNNLTMWTKIPVLPKHIYKDSSEPLYKSRFIRSPIGTGPFILKKWEKNRKIAFIPWEQYWNKPPWLDSYEIYIIPDRTYQYQQLLKGKIDLMEMTREQFLESGNNPDFTSRFHRTALYTREYDYLGYNHKGPLFLRSEKIRTALTLAINREKIIKKIFNGLAVPVTGPSHVNSWGYDNYIPPLDYDPVKAIKLLEEDGWENRDPDNIRYKIINNKKMRLSIKIITHKDSPRRRECVDMICQDLEKIGFMARPWLTDTWEEMLKKYIIPKKFDAYIMGWEIGIEPDVYAIWHSSQNKYGLNHINFADDEVDNWLAKYKSSLSQDEKQIASWRIHKRIHELQAVTFLYSPRKFIAVNKDFKNLRASKNAYSLYPLNYNMWFRISKNNLDSYSKNNRGSNNSSDTN